MKHYVLQALEYLDDIAHGRKMNLDPHELKLTIEKELERLYLIEIMYSNCVIKGAKQKKVLDVIKDYALCIDWIWAFDCIITNKSYEHYISGCEASKDTSWLDKEEYDLLKEVLSL